jgi:hypothetical protein
MLSLSVSVLCLGLSFSSGVLYHCVARVGHKKLACFAFGKLLSKLFNLCEMQNL